MKPLYPTHREKKRYLLIKGSTINKEKIEDAIFDFVGVLGYAEAAPVFIRIQKGLIILAINRGSLEKIRASFLMSDTLFDIIKVSGSLKALKSKMNL